MAIRCGIIDVRKLRSLESKFEEPENWEQWLKQCNPQEYDDRRFECTTPLYKCPIRLKFQNFNYCLKDRYIQQVHPLYGIEQKETNET